MLAQEYARKMLDYLYDDAETDYIFFGQILDVVSYNDDDVPFEKDKERCFLDAIRLTEFLVDKKDFKVGRMMEKTDGTLVFMEFSGGIDEFKAAAKGFFDAKRYDEMQYGLRLSGTRRSRVCDYLPPDIIRLFE
jgi:hypothetical protein